MDDSDVAGAMPGLAEKIRALDLDENESQLLAALLDAARGRAPEVEGFAIGGMVGQIGNVIDPPPVGFKGTDEELQAAVRPRGELDALIDFLGRRQ